MLPHAIPVGVEVTVPAPLPTDAFFTESAYVMIVKFAVMLRFDDMAAVHVFADGEGQFVHDTNR